MIDEIPEVSVVIPCLDEAENVVAIAGAVGAELDRARATYEIIFIDNGSSDGTTDLIRRLCAGDPRIRLIINNRNYGQMRSPTHAIYQAAGRAVIGMCADFQDPPTLIGEFIDRWRAGTPIVLGVRRSEQAGLPVRLARSVGYAVFGRLGDYKVIAGATGFGLYDRRVVDCLKQWRDPEPFFRGMLVESGFALETVPYDRPPRAGGRTKNDFGALLDFALLGLASSSKRLLRAPLYLSFVGFILTALLVVAVGALLLVGAQPWALLAVAGFAFAFSLILFFLGLLGEQIRLIAEMGRNTPLVIEKERVNFPVLAEDHSDGALHGEITGAAPIERERRLP